MAFVGAALMALVIWGCSKKSSSTSSSALTNNGGTAGANVNITFSDNGSGAGGTVTSSPAALDCTASCSHSFSTGTATITLTANPNSSSTASLSGGFNCGSSNCTPPSSWGSVHCSGATCSVVLLSTETTSFTATFTGNSQTSGSIPSLASAISQGGAVCQAMKSIDSSAVTSCGNDCASGTVNYSFSNSGGSVSSGLYTLKGILAETFSGCQVSVGTDTFTLSGTIQETFSNTSVSFSPATDYNNTNWTSITINGDPTLSASGLDVSVNGGSPQSCSIGESLTFNSVVVSNGSNTQSGSTSFTGNSGCVAGQNGSLAGIIRQRR